MLLVAGLAFIALCVLHRGKPFVRILSAVIAVLILSFIGWRDLRRVSPQSEFKPVATTKDAESSSAVDRTAVHTTELTEREAKQNRPKGNLGVRPSSTIGEGSIASRHPLSPSESERFVAGLQKVSTLKGSVRLSCPAADEAACVYAAQYIDIFKTAGWTVEGGIVNRVTLGIPYSGIRLFSHSDFGFDPNMKAGEGHWLKVTPFSTALEQAFINIGFGSERGGEVDLSEDMTNVYFGPPESPDASKATFDRTKKQLVAFRAIPGGK